MYADREEAATAAAKAKSSVKERLNRGSADSLSSRRNVTGKRQRQDDDKWEHDLFKDSETRVTNNKITTRDLRLKLQRKSLQPTTQNGKGSNPGGVRDLREMLSGAMHSQPLNNDIPRPKVAAKPVKKAVDVAPAPETIKVVRPPLKNSKVDMTALVHMSEDDLKALGIPMGPRKKILLALDSKV
uniref:SAM domain-containing protein n=1 Tax=Kalanchoe fedtschenkoi TaxID=63787 RepID=A0A7N1A0Q8_KALFE